MGQLLERNADLEDAFYTDTYYSVKKVPGKVEGNQLISYTGNIPDFEYITMPELEGDNSQEACVSPIPASTLNTPQVAAPSPVTSTRP